MKSTRAEEHIVLQVVLRLCVALSAVKLQWSWHGAMHVHLHALSLHHGGNDRASYSLSLLYTLC